MNMKKQIALLSLCLAPTLLPPSAQAQETHTVSFKAVADTTLFETSPDNNLGGTDTLAAGTTAQEKKARALIRFAPDFGQIPHGAMVMGVSLRMSVLKMPSSGVNSTFELHRMLQPWTEGAKLGNSGEGATAGETTWRARSFPTTLWATAGAAAGTDYATTASSTAAVAGLGNYTWASTGQMMADFEAWKADPSKNFGWILVSNAEGTGQTARRFGSRDSGADAPTLVVEYMMPAADFKIEMIDMTDQFALLHFEMTKDTRYSVQFREDLSPNSSWQTKEVLGPFTDAQHWIFADPREANKQRFYRIEVLH